MHKILLTIAFLLMATVAQASPNYEYVEVKPGETYTNSTSRTQQLRVRKDIEQKTKTEKLNDGINTTVNTLNTTLNSIRAITSVFGIY